MTRLNTREKLQKFHETVQELRSTSLMKKGLNPSMKFHVDFEKQEQKFETKWPEEDDLRSFLLTFRLFIADNEDVFIYRIFNLCHQKLTDDKLRDYLVRARKKWKKVHDTIGFDIVYQGKKYTPKEITNLWLYGVYFHKEEDKRSKLRELPHPLRMFFSFQSLFYLAEATDIIFYVDRIVEKVLKEGLYRD